MYRILSAAIWRNKPWSIRCYVSVRLISLHR